MRHAVLIVVILGGCGGISTRDGDDASVDSPEDAAPDGGVDLTVDGTSTPELDAPLFDRVGTYETVIAASSDPADVYHPDPEDLESGGYAFPLALLLQGAEVGRQHYSIFASIVASHGFVVVVPDHESTGAMGRGLYAEQSEVHDVLAHMRAENLRDGSPVEGVVDVGTLVLLGHSYGGVAGLSVIRDVCQPPFCIGLFTRPAELAGGAFWGTNLAMPFIGTVPSVENDGLPVALVQGTRDGMALPEDGLATYDRIQDPPRAYIEVLGANHYGMCNVDNPPGADPDASTPLLDQAAAVQAIARWSALFLRAHVLGDEAAHLYVHVVGDGRDDVVTVSRQQP